MRTLIRRAAVASVVVLLLLGAAGYGLTLLPSGFVPGEDEGSFFVKDQLPASASLEWTGTNVGIRLANEFGVSAPFC